jgi:hypothetical protein
MLVFFFFSENVAKGVSQSVTTTQTYKVELRTTGGKGVGANSPKINTTLCNWVLYYACTELLLNKLKAKVESTHVGFLESLGGHRFEIFHDAMVGVGVFVSDYTFFA